MYVFMHACMHICIYLVIYDHIGFPKKSNSKLGEEITGEMNLQSQAVSDSAFS